MLFNSNLYLLIYIILTISCQRTNNLEITSTSNCIIEVEDDYIISRNGSSRATAYLILIKLTILVTYFLFMARYDKNTFKPNITYLILRIKNLGKYLLMMIMIIMVFHQF